MGSRRPRTFEQAARHCMARLRDRGLTQTLPTGELTLNAGAIEILDDLLIVLIVQTAGGEVPAPAAVFHQAAQPARAALVDMIDAARGQDVTGSLDQTVSMFQTAAKRARKVMRRSGTS